MTSIKKMRANQRVKTKRYPGPSKRIDACRYTALRAREITPQQIFVEVPIPSGKSLDKLLGWP